MKSRLPGMIGRLPVWGIPETSNEKAGTRPAFS